MNPSEPPTPSSPPRILTVDDEEIVLVALRETLKQQGYTVVTASSAVEGINILSRETFAVVLTDQMMPGLTGLEFLAQAKKIQPDASRILITAVLNVNTVIDAINKAEIFRFILKPWQREEFLAAIRAGIERHDALVQGRAKLAEALGEIASLQSRLREIETRSKP